jgi:hypothetical protein
VNGALSPAVISKLPIGLLGFFGIKNGGQYPQSIVPTIAPTLELAGILAANYNENFSVPCIAALGFVTGNILATGLPAVVPAGELWLVTEFSLNSFTGVGDSMTWAAEARGTQNGSASVWHRSMSPEYSQAASLNRVLAGRHAPLWLQPGDTLGCWFSAATNASGTAQVSLQVKVTRFPS